MRPRIQSRADDFERYWSRMLEITYWRVAFYDGHLFALFIIVTLKVCCVLIYPRWTENCVALLRTRGIPCNTVENVRFAHLHWYVRVKHEDKGMNTTVLLERDVVLPYRASSQSSSRIIMIDPLSHDINIQWRFYDVRESTTAHQLETISLTLVDTVLWLCVFPCTCTEWLFTSMVTLEYTRFITVCQCWYGYDSGPIKILILTLTRELTFYAKDYQMELQSGYHWVMISSKIQNGRGLSAWECAL